MSCCQSQKATQIEETTDQSRNRLRLIAQRLSRQPDDHVLFGQPNPRTVACRKDHCQRRDALAHSPPSLIEPIPLKGGDVVFGKLTPFTRRKNLPAWTLSEVLAIKVQKVEGAED